MARSVVAGQPAVVHAGCFDQAALEGIQQTMCQGSPLVLTGTADQIAFPGTVALNGAAADLTTLVAPLNGKQPGGDDGKAIWIVDLVGKAHTITTPANAILGGKHILTFSGTAGANVSLRALAGVWVIVGNPNGVTAT